MELPDFFFVPILGLDLYPTVDFVATLHAHQIVDIVVGIALGTLGIVGLLFAQPERVLGVNGSCRVSI